MLTHQTFAEFVLKVAALMAHPFGLLGRLEACCLSIFRAFLFALKFALELGEFALATSQPSGILNVFSLRGGEEVRQAKIETDGRAL